MTRPSRSQVEKAIALIQKRGTNYEYFFEKLSDPDWIAALQEADANFFVSPPPAVRTEDSVSFPFWPESEFLARVADKAPVLVAAAISNIPTTDNMRVHQDIAIAAAKLPADLAAKIAVSESEWIKDQSELYFLLPDNYVALAKYLLQSTQNQPAFRLLHAVFGIRPAEGSRSRSRVEAKFDSWHYNDLVAQIVEMAPQAGDPLLRLFSELLLTAVTLENHPRDGGPEDSSYWWRPAIDDHIQNRRNDITSVLVNAVRDSAMLQMQSGAPGVLNFLEAQPYRIFHRIALYLRSQVPDYDPSGNYAWIEGMLHVDDVYFKRERYQLLKRQFGGMPADIQKRYIEQATAGPNIADWVRTQEEIGMQPSIEDQREYTDGWILDRLWPIASDLDADNAALLNEIVERRGPPPDILIS